jgi:aspartate kinase
MRVITLQKFGGTSVGTIERIQSVAKLVLKSYHQGLSPVVVVSAMSGETNRLVELAHQISPIPYSREYDLLIASGEQIAVGLVTLAINAEAKNQARGLLGYQIGIRTDSVYSKARIEGIDTGLIRSLVDSGIIPVIAGFQGVDPDNNITTLGRGGSDTSAVALAAALNAHVCEIYTDVDGVYTTDPRLCSRAKKIERISYQEMMELASLGAKVLQIRSVELAAKFNVPIHVRSSFNDVPGTWVVSQEQLGDKMEQVVVAGVAADVAQVKISLQNLSDMPGVAADIFGALSSAAVVVDVIVQDISSSGRLTVSFTVAKNDHPSAMQALRSLTQPQYSSMGIVEETDLAKVSIVGVGMQHHPGVASKMFALLSQAGINIKLITTSEIKISCLIEASQAKKAVECLHDGFALEN